MWGVWGVSMLYGGVSQFDFYVCSLYGMCEVNVRYSVSDVEVWCACAMCVFGINVVGGWLFYA